MNYTDETWGEVKRAAALLREARHAVALTGAGSSTPSGIPDFRTPGLGLWERVDPIKVASIYAFRQDPHAFYDWMRPMVRTLLAAEPNAGHRALAELEEDGRLKAVITQNIDDLHQRAGSREVVELHGHVREATCIHCYIVLPTGELLKGLLDSGETPRCPACDGVMKPNVVLFGEQLPFAAVNAAMAHIRQADLMLIAGSSLEVMPVSHLPVLVRERGGRLIVVNLSPTYIDDVADIVIRGDVVEVLPLIARVCAEG